jgi:diguanylate cyclase (GGDEF)-like protein
MLNGIDSFLNGMKKITTKRSERTIIDEMKYVLFGSQRSILNWTNFDKGILLLIFCLGMLLGHGVWYYHNFNSDYQIFLDAEYYSYRMFTTLIQIILAFSLLSFALFFRRNIHLNKALGVVIPLFFGLELIFSGYSVGIYSPAVISGMASIILIGLVLYERKIIYSITSTILAIFLGLAYLTANDRLSYAPLFSDLLNESEVYANEFWLRSMVVLYLPILAVWVIFFEIILSQWRRRERKIEILSQKDALTNLFNRRYINHFITSLIKQNRQYAFVIIDLDYFKKINDTYGHDAGDIVLKRVANILMIETNRDDIVGRLGGEEFVLVLPDCNLELANQISERCRRGIERLKITINENITLSITASLGIAVSNAYDQQNLTIDENKQRIYSVADRALYLAKQNGRNLVRDYRDLTK